MSPEAMISSSAKSEWQKWKQRLESSETNKVHGGQECTSIHNIQDTVGAVAWTDNGEMAAGVSRRVFY
jgi:taspase (threonine aspartase 1)